MGLFDVFKKKNESSYDPNNIRVTDLAKGFIFEYDMSTWEVTEEYSYDWGGNFFTREFKVENGSLTRYLSVENDDDLYLTLTKKVRIRKLDQDLPEYIMDRGSAPKILFYDGKKYFLEKESPGYFKNVSSNEDKWSELISWDYYDDDEEYCLSVERWGENEFEATAGRIIKEFEISNILPKN